MSAPHRRAGHAPLRVEHLEDRTAPAYDPGRVLVTFATPNPTAEQLAALGQAEPIGFGVYCVELADNVTVATALPALRALPGVAAAEPNSRVSVARVPNDPTFSSQWGLSAVSAPRGWDATTGTRQTIVAVIDTGLDYTHPDLSANVWRNPGETANGRDDDGNGFVDDLHGADFVNNDGNPMDDHGHGTHVTGVIGAVGNNGVGVSGVAWSTRIMALKFMAANGVGYTSDAIRALDYAIARGARVVNLSWGGGGYDAAMVAAIGRARAAGVVIVAAAGNQGANTDAAPFYPAGYAAQSDNVVTVAATTQSSGLASYSNFGRTSVTLAAPGHNIRSTVTGGRYGAMSGTSMAAPFVSGALAVLWDQNPGWTYQQVIARLKQSAVPVAALAGKTQTGGRLDLANLLGVPATTDRTGPRVAAFEFGGPAHGVLRHVRLTFTEAINPTTLTPADVTVVGPAGAVAVSGIYAVAGTGNTQFDAVFTTLQTAAGAYTVTVGPDVCDAAGNLMDQDADGTPGETADRFTGSATLLVPPPPAQSGRPVYYAAGMPKTINDRRTTRVEFTVTGDFRVSDLAVQLAISHGRASDLSIRIVAPDGRLATLFNRRGGVGANLAGTVFNDRAAVSVANAAAPFAGQYRPEQPFAVFDGMSARGVWVVQIFDLADGATGHLHSAAISFAVPGAQGVQTTAPTVRPMVAGDLRGAAPELVAAVLTGRGDIVTPPPKATPGATRRAPDFPKGEALQRLTEALWLVSVDLHRDDPTADLDPV